MKKHQFLVVLFVMQMITLHWTNALAQTQAGDELRLLDKYSLVGVIANSTEAKNHRGIAVIKDLNSKRSITIGVGEFLPYSSVKVEAIMRDHVQLSDSRNKYELRNVPEFETRAEIASAKDAATSSDQFNSRREPGTFDQGVSVTPVLPVTIPGSDAASEPTAAIDFKQPMSAEEEQALYEHARALIEEMQNEESRN